MIRESFFVKAFVSICAYLKNSWLESRLYHIYCSLAYMFTKWVEESTIISFLSSDWEKKLGLSECRLMYKAEKISQSKALKKEKGLLKLLKESVLISIANENMLVCLIYLIFFALPFLPTMVLLGLCLISLALYVLNIFVGRIKFRLNGMTGIFIILFGAAYIMSSLTSGNISQSLKVMGVFIVFLSMFFITADSINTEKRLNVLINVFILSALLVSLYGIYQYITGAEMDAAWVDSNTFEDIKTRVYATFTNPNVLGEYLIVMTALSIGMFWQEKRLVFKIYYMVLSGIMGLCLICTNSRGSMLGLILAAGFFVLLSEKRLLIAGILAVLAMPFIMPESLWQRLSSVTALNDSSSLYRISIYKASLNMLKNYWFGGIGVAAFNNIYPMFSFEAANAYHSHNLFLQEFLELGIVGFTAFIASIIFFMQRIYFAIKNSSRKYQILLGTIFGGFAGLLLQGMVDYIWFDYSIILFYWAVMGLGMCMIRLGGKAK